MHTLLLRIAGVVITYYFSLIDGAIVCYYNFGAQHGNLPTHSDEYIKVYSRAGNRTPAAAVKAPNPSH